jgi:RNA polymerase sigma factor (sigma-70 family)
VNPRKVVSIEDYRARALARRDRLVNAHLGLVDAIAARVHSELPPSFDLDDLVGIGYVALLDAAARYRPLKHGGAPFEAFARHRIRGAMLDSVKRRHYLENTRPSIDDVPEPMAETSIEISIDAGRHHRKVKAAVAQLPPRLRVVIELYHSDEGPSLRQVGKQMNLSKSRVLQLHASAIAELRRQGKCAA